MNYQETIDYIFSLANRGIKLGLENTRRLLIHFDNPQLKIRTIHIAGTNGKGSTASFAASILKAAGYRIGLFTSPHLNDFRERLQINGELISEENLINLTLRIQKASSILKIKPTYFEFSAILAFLYFFESQTDFNVIEVGMGGRLDATNLCQGEVCVITNISRDHESSLGSKLTDIAFEKASIIKNSCTVITGFSQSSLLEVVSKQAKLSQSPVFSLGKDFFSKVNFQNSEVLNFNFSGFNFEFNKLNSRLIGKFQANNASTAIAACLALSKNKKFISEECIQKGIFQTLWPGRLEIIQENPKVILDCAHNLKGCENLAKTINELFPNQPGIVIFGVMKDKPHTEMIDFISDIADYYILTKPKNERSVSPEDIRDIIIRKGKPFEIIEEMPKAIKAALELCKENSWICITGSIFTIAEARKILEN